jgi:glycosyltransferase involved in cell wall biosynthesis
MRVLHVMHSWGGGLDRWVLDFCSVSGNQNYLLKSIGDGKVIGRALQLVEAGSDRAPQTYPLKRNIPTTDIFNLEYAQIVDSICQKYQIDILIVSSLIGHAIDILLRPTPKILICHDYYPFCPALNIYFNQICESCTSDRLSKCFSENLMNRHFFYGTPQGWQLIRKYFFEALKEKNITCIIPTPSVKSNYLRITKEFEDINFIEIAHGFRGFREVLTASPCHSSLEKYDADFLLQPVKSSRPKVVILGRLAAYKGAALLIEIYQTLFQEIDFYLIGCGHEVNKFFSERTNLYVLENYERADLPVILEQIKPDLGLLLSIVPETYSYTLSELLVLQIPTLAVNCGSFSDRIRNGVNGYLCEPQSSEFVAKIKYLLSKPQDLDQVRKNLASFRPKTIEVMVTEYQGIMEDIIKTGKVNESDTTEETKQASITRDKLADISTQLIELTFKIDALEYPNNGSQRALDQVELEYEQRLKKMELEYEQKLKKMELEYEQKLKKMELEYEQKLKFSLQEAYQELQVLREKIDFMERSRFWKLRNAWFRIRKYF